MVRQRLLPKPPRIRRGLYIVGLRDFVIYFFYHIGLVHWRHCCGSISYQTPSQYVTQNLARQLYPLVIEHVNLYYMRRDVCFLRFKYGVE